MQRQATADERAVQRTEIRFRDVRPSEVGVKYWAETQSRRLPLRRCANGHVRIYLTRVCPVCGSTESTIEYASGGGAIYAWTENRYPLSDEFEAPYVVALVDLDEGVRMMANVLDGTAENLTIGARVQLTFEELPDGKQLPQFVLESDS